VGVISERRIQGQSNSERLSLSSGDKMIMPDALVGKCNGNAAQVMSCPHDYLTVTAPCAGSGGDKILLTVLPRVVTGMVHWYKFCP
jgi:hypothetical protein